MSTDNISSTNRIALESAIGVYNTSALYKNEIARSTYKLGCVLQKSGAVQDGRRKMEEAELMRWEILGEEAGRATDGESAFDNLVMFWSR